MAGPRVSVVLGAFALLCAPGIGEAASIKGKVVVAGPVPAAEEDRGDNRSIRVRQ